MCGSRSSDHGRGHQRLAEAEAGAGEEQNRVLQQKGSGSGEKSACEHEHGREAQGLAWWFHGQSLEAALLCTLQQFLLLPY